MRNREATVRADLDRGTGNEDLRVKALTLAILALFFSPFFPISVPLAYLALSRNKQNPQYPTAAKVVAFTAIIISYLGLVAVAFLASKGRHYSQ